MAARRLKPELHSGALDSLFRLGRKPVFADNVAFILAKGSPIKRELDMMLARLVLSGQKTLFLDYLYND